MKKYICAFAATGILLLTACTQDNSNYNLAVNGKVEGLKQGRLYLYKVQDTAFTVVDSVVIKGNPEFYFKLNIDSPEMFFLTLDRGHSNSIDNHIQFFAEPGKIEINTTLKNFFRDTKITGSKNNDIYLKYLKTRALITNRQNDLLVDIFNAEKEDNQFRIDSLSALNKKLTGRLYLNAVNFAINHNDSDVAPYIALTELYDRNTKYLDTIYNSLQEDIASHKYGQQLKEYIQEIKYEDNTEQ